MKKLFFTSIIFIAFSCQVEDENAPLPTDGFIKYIGDLAEQEGNDIEPIYNSDSTSVDTLVIFGTQQLEGQLKDYYVALVDAAGNLLVSNSYGFEREIIRDFDRDGIQDTIQVPSDEVAGQIEAVPGVGYVFIGTSTINDPTRDIVDLSFITIGLVDQQLNLLSQNLVPIFGDLDNQLDLIGNDIIRLRDGSFVIVGAIESSTDLDFYYRRFSLNNLDSAIWEQTLGLMGGGLDDVLVRAFENENGNINLFGYSEDTGDEGEGGTNVTYIEVNENGNILNANSSGIEDVPPFVFSDVLTNVIRKPGGYLAVGTSTVDDRQYAFFMDISPSGLINRRDTIGSLFTLGTEQLQTLALGVTTTITNDFVLVGTYPSFRTDTENRGAEAMFKRVNQSGETIAGFESNYGLGDGDDSASDAITLPDGKIMVLTNVDFGGGVKLIGLIKLNDTGELDE